MLILGFKAWQFWRSFEVEKNNDTTECCLGCGIENMDGDLCQDCKVIEWAMHKLAGHVHSNAVNKGFWDEERNVGELIALIHSELSEMLEAYRHGNPKSDHIQASAVEEEMADVLIRLLDMAVGLTMNVPRATMKKLAFNRTRPKKHGKEF